MYKKVGSKEKASCTKVVKSLIHQKPRLTRGRGPFRRALWSLVKGQWRLHRRLAPLFHCASIVRKLYYTGSGRVLPSVNRNSVSRDLRHNARLLAVYIYTPSSYIYSTYSALLHNITSRAQSVIEFFIHVDMHLWWGAAFITGARSDYSRSWMARKCGFISMRGMSALLRGMGCMRIYIGDYGCLTCNSLDNETITRFHS